MRSLVESLVTAGFSEDDARTRATLIGSVDQTFTARIETPPAWRFWVPGRVEFFGKHTDYAGGRSLVAAVPRGFAVAARERPDDIVRVLDARRGGEVSIRLTDTTTAHRGWHTYVATVVRRLAANFPGARLGADVVVASDLPSAAGLSSSSGLIVGLASVLIERGSLNDRDDWREAITSRSDLAGYLGAIEAGASYGRLAGTTGVGTHGGSEDHTAIVAARPGMLSEYRYMPVRHIGDVRLPDGWACVVATSGVHADKIGSARDRFNRAAAAVRALLGVWGQATNEEARSLAAALAADPDRAMRLAAAIPTASIPGFTADELVRRLTHFLREDPRVEAAARAFAANDDEALDVLSRDSQADAETLLGNQVPETVALVAAAREAGAFAASSFGAGFGGSAWALVPVGEVERFGPAWVGRYRLQCGPVRDRIEWFRAQPSPSVCLV